MKEWSEWRKKSIDDSRFSSHFYEIISLLLWCDRLLWCNVWIWSRQCASFALFFLPHFVWRCSEEIIMTFHCISANQIIISNFQRLFFEYNRIDHSVWFWSFVRNQSRLLFCSVWQLSQIAYCNQILATRLYIDIKIFMRLSDIRCDDSSSISFLKPVIACNIFYYHRYFLYERKAIWDGWKRGGRGRERANELGVKTRKIWKKKKNFSTYHIKNGKVIAMEMRYMQWQRNLITITAHSISCFALLRTSIEISKCLWHSRHFRFMSLGKILDFIEFLYWTAISVLDRILLIWPFKRSI